MRVILATDGSAPAAIAADLVSACRWPMDTWIDVVGVLDAGALLPGPFAPGPADVQPLEDALRDGMAEMLGQTADRLRASGFRLTTTLRMGRPMEAVVDRAIEIDADLIVCGSRGQGELRALVMGSVAAGLAERAPCAVLVARHGTVGRVLLADDGTEPALAAEHVVATWPMFQGMPVDVLSIAYVHPAWRTAIAMLTVGTGLTRYEAEVREAKERVRQVADDAVARLDTGGRRATGLVREGDPAEVILAETEGRSADLIVVGTHGRMGWERLMLGSVARAVLLQAHASVLVVPPVRLRPPGPPDRARLAPTHAP